MYAAVASMVVNILLCAILTIVLKNANFSIGEDNTDSADYEVHPVSVIKKTEIYVRRSKAL